jgi:hypothetical protein
METENIQLEKPPKCVCPKHGEVRDDYVFRVNMPEFGYEKLSYCLVCAVEYLAMIAQEIQYVKQDEEETKE